MRYDIYIYIYIYVIRRLKVKTFYKCQCHEIKCKEDALAGVWTRIALLWRHYFSLSLHIKHFEELLSDESV